MGLPRSQHSPTIAYMAPEHSVPLANKLQVYLWYNEVAQVLRSMGVAFMSGIRSEHHQASAMT